MFLDMLISAFRLTKDPTIGEEDFSLVIYGYLVFPSLNIDKKNIFNCFYKLISKILIKQ